MMLRHGVRRSDAFATSEDTVQKVTENPGRRRGPEMGFLSGQGDHRRAYRPALWFERWKMRVHASPGD